MKLNFNTLGALTVICIFGFNLTAFASKNKIGFYPDRTTPRKIMVSPHQNAPGFAAPMAAKALAPSVEPYFAQTIDTDAQFEEMSAMSDGLVKGPVMKFLIDNRTATPQIYFINGSYLDENGMNPEYVRFHYMFAQKKLQLKMDGDAFNNATYFTNDLKKKLFIAGTLQRYSIGSGATAEKFFGFQFYPQDAIAESSIVFVANIIKNAVRVPTAALSFVAYGSQQSVLTVKNQMDALGVKTRSVDQIIGSVPVVVMNPGTAVGYIRTFPKKSEWELLTQKDIPVFDQLPLDLSVVAGVFTTVVQDAGSHVNLKSKERKTPNVIIRDPKRIELFKTQYDGQPVRITVGVEDYKIDIISRDEVEAYYNKLVTGDWNEVKSSTDKTMRSFSEMATGTTPAQTISGNITYGGKASKLGFLGHPKVLGIGSPANKSLKYRITPMGFGIPIAYYFDFVNANPKLQTNLKTVFDTEMRRNNQVPMNPADKVKAVNDLQELFYNASVPDALVKALVAKAQQFKTEMAQAFPQATLKKVKLRSSANAEDVEGFDGAGLHSSYSVSIDDIGDPNEPCKVVDTVDGVTTKSEVVPSTLLCGMKAVYASLWNKRAIEERTYAHIPQDQAGMGIAVNQTYGFREIKVKKGAPPAPGSIKEIANGVIISRVINSGGIYGYRISVNDDENLVTNPTPDTQSEVSIAAFVGNEKPEYTFTQFAKSKPTDPVRTEPMLKRETYDRIVDLVKRVEIAYCEAVPKYYRLADPKHPKTCSFVTSDPDKTKSLDLEVKVFDNGEVLVKQVREFSGT